MSDRPDPIYQMRDLAALSLDQSPLEVFWVLPSGKITGANESGVKNLGYTREEMNNIVAGDIDQYFTTDRLYRLFLNLSQREAIVVPSIRQRRDGTIYPVETSISHLIFEDREYLFCTARPLLYQSVQKDSPDDSTTAPPGHDETLKSGNTIPAASACPETEEDLQIVSALFEAIVDHTPDIIMIVRADHKILMLNNAGCEAFGIPPGSIEGRYCYEILGKERPCTGCILDRTIESGMMEKTEYSIPSLNRKYLLHGIPVRDQDGKIAFIILQYSDIGDQAARECTIRETNEKLRLLSRITAHDVFNQLSVLIGYLELARGRQEPQGTNELIDQAEAAALAIRRLIECMKDYQKIGSASPSWQRIDAIVEGQWAELSTQGLVLSLETDGIEVYADPLLRKIFYNLMDNTLKHSRNATSVRVSSRMTNGSICIIYENDGAGIPDELKETIFERGFGDHSGYGLYLVRKILSITGFKIIECGKAGDGVRFEISVPEGCWRRSG